MIFRLRHLNTGRLVVMQEIENHDQNDKEKIKTLGCAAHLQLNFEFGRKKNMRMKVKLSAADA